MVLTRAGRTERINSAAAQLLGRGVEELVDGEPCNLVHPEDLEAALSVRSDLVAARVPPPQDRRIVRPDGQIVHARLTFSALDTGEAGAERSFLIHIHDRTAEVHAAQAHEDALRLFSTAVDQAPIGMCLVGLDGRFLRVNDALCRLLERPPAELLDSTFHHLTHPQDLQADLALLEECLAGVRDRYEMPKRYLTPSGRVVHAFLSVSLIRDVEGRPEHFVSQIVDLTDAHEAKERTRILEDRDRIAHDLHDHVIQHLFAVGLSLQALAGTPAVAGVRDRLEQAIAEIDVTIKGVRDAIYGMRAPGHGSGAAVRDRVTGIVDELTPILGCRPRLRLSGPLEVAVAGELVDDLLAALRESLLSCATHGQVSAVEIEIDVDPGSNQLTMIITPDHRTTDVSPLRNDLEDPHVPSPRSGAPARTSSANGEGTVGREASVTWTASLN